MEPFTFPTLAPGPPRLRDLGWQDILGGLQVQGGARDFGGALSNLGAGLINSSSYALEQKKREYEAEEERKRLEAEQKRELERRAVLDAQEKRRLDAQIAASDASRKAAEARALREDEKAQREKDAIAKRSAIAASGDETAALRSAYADTGDPRYLSQASAAGKETEYRFPLGREAGIVAIRKPDGNVTHMQLARGALSSGEGITGIKEFSTGKHTVITDQAGRKLAIVENQNPGPQEWQKRYSKSDLDDAEDGATAAALRDIERLVNAGKIPGMDPEALKTLVSSGEINRDETFLKLFRSHLDNTLSNMKFSAEELLRAQQRAGTSGGPSPVDPASPASIGYEPGRQAGLAAPSAGVSLPPGFEPPRLPEPAPRTDQLDGGARGSRDASILGGGPLPKDPGSFDLDSEIRAISGNARTGAWMKLEVMKIARETGVSLEQAFRAFVSGPKL